MPTTNTARRTADQANYSLNRRPENRRIYAEQQVAWFYADLLKAQHGKHRVPLFSSLVDYWYARQMKAERDLAEAHAHLDALTAGLNV